MDFETVKVKTNIDEQGNGTFPSNSNIVSHDGMPLRDVLLSMNKTIPEFTENEDGSIKLIFDDGK